MHTPMYQYCYICIHHTHVSILLYIHTPHPCTNTAIYVYTTPMYQYCYIYIHPCINTAIYAYTTPMYQYCYIYIHHTHVPILLYMYTPHPCTNTAIYTYTTPMYQYCYICIHHTHVSILLYMHTPHPCINTAIYAYTHVSILLYMHTPHPCTNTAIYTYTTPMYQYCYICIHHTHVPILLYMHTPMYQYCYIYIYPCINTAIYAYTHVPILLYMHTPHPCINTAIYTYTHVPILLYMHTPMYQYCYICIHHTHVSILLYIVHPESFNTQNAIAFAYRNRPRVKRNDAFVCVYLRSCAFASTVHNRPRARTCVRMRVRTYIYTQLGKVWAWRINLYTPTSTAPTPASAPATSQPHDLRDSPCVVVNRSKVMMPRRCQVSRACSGSSSTTAAGRFQPNRIFRSRTHRCTAGSAPAPARLCARRAPSHQSRSARPPAPRVLSPNR